MYTGNIQPVGIGETAMVTETWIPFSDARQYLLCNGYATNCLIGMCKNPDAMRDALNADTLESGEYAITLNKICGEHLESQVWMRSRNRDVLNKLYFQIKIGNLQTTITIHEYADKQGKKFAIEKTIRGGKSIMTGNATASAQPKVKKYVRCIRKECTLHF